MSDDLPVQQLSLSLRVNLVNSYCRDNDTLPLEFQYAPANYTMQLTVKMAKSITERWRIAAQILWG